MAEIKMFSDLEEKVVLITGASGYLGEAIAVEFARHGSRLVLTGRNTTKLEKTASLCKQVGLTDEKLLVIAADISDESGVDRVIHETIDKFRIIHILVNNAGIFMMGDSNSLTSADIELVFDINCRSVFMLTQKLIPYLVENQGFIVSISSTASLRANAGAIAYCMSKACLDRMTKSLALELGPKGVRVNGINPSTVEDSTMYKAMDISPQYDNILRTLVPMGRLCRAEDVAKAVLFLTSKRASYLTGVSIPIDGGFCNQKLFMLKRK